MKAKYCMLMHIWTQTHIFNTANLPQQSTVESISHFPVWGFRFLQIICRLFKHYCVYNPTGAIRSRHTHPHTHDSNNFPPPAACCGSWSAASVNWLSAEEEEEKEEGAAGHEQQRRWRPIGNQCTMSISAPYGQNTRSDSCHSPLQPASSHTERENVNCAASTLSGV